MSSWTCFFCDETFVNPALAREHFGEDPSAHAGCQIKRGNERNLLKEIRRLQRQWSRCLAEDCDIIRQRMSRDSEHRQALIKAEEDGYTKGLADGRKEPIV